MRAGRGFSSIANHSKSKSKSSHQVALTAFTVRPAQLSDTPDISNCNRRSLPENFSNVFLDNYIRRWPDLTLVATDASQTVIAYTLGRVGDVYDTSYKYSNVGFLTSIAVDPEHRGLGLGNTLLNKMHENMIMKYRLESTSLHCRETNQRAVGFYFSMGYEVNKVLTNYYRDAGTALLLKKQL